ncbi:hypothetical protein M378DRAFT_763542 [Amanita muscaria Koide BX008]|uniref:Uncharacterized protein n=1 Tax=Amanita muscaria (strain Koide BX008) TaxID=946122 RepID=A0A0C2XJ68_AMAMK|nr:hypothetical protein M378DRAFT_763542 [Amanita muscaria Koide BX008]
MESICMRRDFFGFYVHSSMSPLNFGALSIGYNVYVNDVLGFVGFLCLFCANNANLKFNCIASLWPLKIRKEVDIVLCFSLETRRRNERYKLEMLAMLIDEEKCCRRR